MASYPTQPLDEWNSMADEEDTSDGDPRTSIAEAPELAAMHLQAEEPRSPAHDPSRSDVALTEEAEEDQDPASHFPDEEPQTATTLTLRQERSTDDHEPDLEEILESQHYSFARQSTDTGSSSA